MVEGIFLGIDPGLDGAIAIIDAEARRIEFRDTPTVEIKVGKNFKRHMALVACVKLLEDVASERGPVRLVSIEKVQAMPGGGERSMGATSAFTFGMGFGQWLGILAALKFPYQTVHPATWKAAMMRGCSKEKDASRVKAMELYPYTNRDLYLKKHHGRADALLIGDYGRRMFNQIAAAPATEQERESLFS